MVDVYMGNLCMCDAFADRLIPFWVVPSEDVPHVGNIIQRSGWNIELPMPTRMPPTVKLEVCQICVCHVCMSTM